MHALFTRFLNGLLKLSTKGFSIAILLMFCLSVSYASDQSYIQSLKDKIKPNSSDTATITTYLQLASCFDGSSKNQLDSSLYYLNEALVLSQITESEKHIYSTYLQYSKLFFKNGNFAISLDYHFKCLKLIDENLSLTHDTLAQLKKYISIYAQLGSCYFNMENFEMALQYYQESLDGVEKIVKLDKDYPYLKNMVVLYTNIGSTYLSTYNTVAAQTNFEKALEYNLTFNNPDFNGSLYNNMGIVHKERKEYGKAFYYYYKSLEIRTQLKDTVGIAQTTNNLGNTYYFVGEYKKAIDILNKAMSLSTKTGSLLTRMRAGSYLSLAYEKDGNYPKALEMHKLYKSLQDSMMNNEKVQNTARMEMQYQYEKQRKEDELQKQIIIAHKERKALIYMIISALLLFSFAIVILLNRNQRIRMKQGELLQESLRLESLNLNLEKQNLLMEKQNLEMELEFRNKELSTHVMYLFKKNEFISSIIDKLLALKSKEKPENNAWIMEILREMQSNVDNTVWEEFEKRFQQVHQDFYEKLLVKYPDLTPNEIKICAFMKLNMTTKDISAITFQSVKSIQVARNRLRKKMGITRDENLILTIQQL